MPVSFPIIYSTQLGTAKRLAEQFYNELKDLNLQSSVQNISEIDPSTFSQKDFYIFLISTHFDGDSCDDGVYFYKWMKSKTPKPFLQGVKFTIFGLGDITFKKFNTPASFYFEKFQKNGMLSFHPMALGSDHMGNVEGDFEIYKKSLLEAICRLKKIDLQGKKFHNGLLFSIKNLSYLQAEVEQNKELQMDEDYQMYQRTLLGFISQIEKKESNLREELYRVKFESDKITEDRTGQMILFYPQNSKKILKQVKQYFDLENQNAHLIIDKQDDSVVAPFNSGVSIKQAITYFIDFTSCPSFQYLQKLTQILEPNEKGKIIKLLQNKELLFMYQQKRYGIIKILQDQDIKVSFEKFCNLAEKLKPRIYFVASQTNNQIEFMVYQKQKRRILTNEWKGLFSNQIENLYQNYQHKPIKFTFKQGAFADYLKYEKILMIGQDLGIAPFLSIIQKQFKRKEVEQQKLSLFYECQSGLNFFCPSQLIKKMLETSIITEDNDIIQQVEKKTEEIKEFLQDGVMFICCDQYKQQEIRDCINKFDNFDELLRAKKILVENYN